MMQTKFDCCDDAREDEGSSEPGTRGVEQKLLRIKP
jgi:hypothetical protein